MSDSTSYNGDKEIDLASFKRGISAASDSVGSGIYRLIRFVVRNAVGIGVMIVLGVGLGLLLDSSDKQYDNAVIVVPNFGAVDYTYNKVELLQAKIAERDTNFLKEVVKIPKPKRLLKIEIEPIVDVYPFISQRQANYDMLKLLAENNDIKKIIEDKTTSKNFIKHLLTFSTLKRSDKKEILEPILAYLNDTKFYQDVQKQYLWNLNQRIHATEQTINQINGVLDGFAANTGASGKSSMVYINENTQLNDVIETKSDLVQLLGEMRLEQVSADKVVKEFASVTNKENKSITSGKMKFWLPLIFIILYLFFANLVRIYKKQSALEKQKIA